mmetsp:Transcript_35075/g.40534  ORF Transcript_35075/g.40534 Transcript_35075/m.40534 type:complete len:172 (+) Transcript_35075:760-1275(+)
MKNGKKLSHGGSFSNLDYSKPLSSEEKKELGRNIRHLTPQQLRGVIAIVRDMFPEKNGMLEFDIDKLPSYKLRELEEYVRNVKGGAKKPLIQQNQYALNRSNSANFSGTAPGRAKFSSNPEDMRRGMSGMYQQGIIDPSSALGGGKMLNDSSDSDSESSNSSVGSDDGLDV